MYKPIKLPERASNSTPKSGEGGGGGGGGEWNRVAAG